MRTIFFLLILAGSASAQILEKRAGETVFLTIFISHPSDAIKIYMHTRGYLPTQQLLTSIPVVIGKWSYTVNWTMPTGTEPQYRFFAVPVRGTEFLEESNGVRVKRKP